MDMKVFVDGCECKWVQMSVNAGGWYRWGFYWLQFLTLSHSYNLYEGNSLAGKISLPCCWIYTTQKDSGGHITVQRWFYQDGMDFLCCIEMCKEWLIS